MERREDQRRDERRRRLRGGRVSKPPEERRRELLETAMRLFTERGYENTSMRDIAEELGVVQGLCYRYFDSKQKLFGEAMELYAAECCAGFLPVLEDPGLTLRQKLDQLFGTLAHGEEGMRYHEFFHRHGNEELHEQLSLRLCRHLRPALLRALQLAEQREGLRVRDPATLVDFIVCGQISLLSRISAPRPEQIALVREYVEVLLTSQTISASTPG